uniref:Uncharacterized protein n=1 Tax=Arundo donax TaxID=35708 RepID=A0A0A8YXN5_ARUDO
MPDIFTLLLKPHVSSVL